MTPQQDHARNIEELLIDTRKRLNAAADRGNIPEVSRLAEQIKSLARMLELVA